MESKQSTLFTRPEAANYLRVKKSTLDAWAVRGGGPKFCKMGKRSVRYRKSDLDAFIEASVVSNTSEV